MLINTAPLKHLGKLALIAITVAGISVSAREGRGGGGDDAAARAAERVERARADSNKNADRAARDEARFAEERAKIIARAEKEPKKAAEDLAELEADRQEDLEKAAADDVREAEELAEDLARYEEMPGSSQGMRDIAREERPDYDDKGYPVRKSEIVALDLSDKGVQKAKELGFEVFSREELAALGNSVTRLAVPDRRSAKTALGQMKDIDPQATFDFTHYYGMQISQSGGESGKSTTALQQKEANFTVGMIDTGVTRHQSLVGSTISARSFGAKLKDVPTAHGTAVASILVSEGARNLYVANIFRGRSGTPYTSAEAVASALEWLVNNKVAVINMSLAGPRNAILDQLIMRASAKGFIIVAAAGNGGPGAPPAYPAALPQVIAVTAVDSNFRVYRYANQGNFLDFAALGVNQLAAKAGGGTALFSGTSFATPHVAARLAACRMSSSGKDCRGKLFASARDLGNPGFDPVYGNGLIQ